MFYAIQMKHGPLNLIPESSIRFIVITDHVIRIGDIKDSWTQYTHRTNKEGYYGTELTTKDFNNLKESLLKNTYAPYPYVCPACGRGPGEIRIPGQDVDPDTTAGGPARSLDSSGESIE